MLSVGIIGLPNVGKSTLFNALTSGSANVSNYPFTTIDSNVGVVAVPDPRLEDLSAALKPEETTPTFIQFIDIAGLVRGASRGEGLGNQFLGNIRSVDAIAHVIRCFVEEEVVHVFGDVDGARDIDVVETELLLADLEVMDRLIEKRVRSWKTSPRQYAAEEKRFKEYRESLVAGTPLRELELDAEAQKELKSLGLLTGKPIFYVANITEHDLDEPSLASVSRIHQSRINLAPTVVTVCAKLEWELVQLSPEERSEFMEALELKQSGLDRVVSTAYGALDLLTFYTMANHKLRAWTISRGTHAPAAAGKIHSDMEKGFIRAQVVKSDQVLIHKTFPELHRHGLIRTEGKDYEIQEGDVVEFFFSP